MASIKERASRPAFVSRGKGFRWFAMLVAFALTLATGLSGCLLNRVMEVKQQVCEFDENFELRFDDSPTIVMNRPVLLDRDIMWLAGTPPTYTVSKSDELIMTYMIEEDIAEPNSANDIRVDLSFILFDEEFRLNKVQMDPKFSTVINQQFLNEETIMESAQNICNVGLGIASTKIEMDITEQELEMLPTRQEILELMGPPHAMTEEDHGWIYRYRLKGNQDESQVAVFTVWFNETSEKPVRMKSQYDRFHSFADFEAKKISMNMKL